MFLSANQTKLDQSTSRSLLPSRRLVVLALAGALLMSVGLVSQAQAFEGGTGTPEDPYQVATAEQLDSVRDDLGASYVLVDDIDLTDYANWQPIGAFAPRSEAPEDAEMPSLEVAFTGTFDGAGHTVSNLVVDEPMGMAVGLFGCAAGDEDDASISNLVLRDVTVNGYYLVGGAVGLQFMGCPVTNVTLEGTNALSGAQGIGGIVGTGFDLIEGCSATADIVVLGDGGAAAGIVAGGTTFSPIVDCVAHDGSVVAEGDGCWGLGCISGAPYAAPQISGCTVSDCTISCTGEGSRLIGGVAGFAGTYQGADPALVSGNTVEGVVITADESTTGIGALVGEGKEESDQGGTVASFVIDDCEAQVTIAIE